MQTTAVTQILLCSDAHISVVSFLPKSRDNDLIAFGVNATPMARYNYRLGVPESGFYSEVINTDAETYTGSNVGNLGGVQSEALEWMGRERSILIHLPPLATVALKFEKQFVRPSGELRKRWRFRQTKT